MYLCLEWSRVGNRPDQEYSWILKLDLTACDFESGLHKHFFFFVAIRYIQLGKYSEWVSCVMVVSIIATYIAYNKLWKLFVLYTCWCNCHKCITRVLYELHNYFTSLITCILMNTNPTNFWQLKGNHLSPLHTPYISHYFRLWWEHHRWRIWDYSLPSLA